MMKENPATGTPAKEIVLLFIKALNNEDFKTARNYADEGVRFEGVLGSRDGADVYFKDMEQMKLKYDIKKVFVEGNDVCLFYDVRISGISVFSCGWYLVENDKIRSIKVLFDPRPILELSRKN